MVELLGWRGLRFLILQILFKCVSYVISGVVWTAVRTAVLVVSFGEDEVIHCSAWTCLS